MKKENTEFENIQYNLTDELSSAVTHALGGYLGAAAVVLLVIFAIWSGEQVAWKIVASSIFASTIIILYSASTLYHAVTNLRIKELMRVCDQMAIYMLIAGTYTPLCLVSLRPNYPVLSWTIFVGVWALALSGIVFKLLAVGQMKYTTTITYLTMGWFGIFLLQPLYVTMPLMGIIWVVLGGVFYSLGVVFYLWKTVPLHHTIWHLFVLAGTISHFFCVLFYVVM
jgi:hemolysin III